MSAKMPGTRICTEFTRGELVWAHLKGYPHWPAIVISHREENKRTSSKYVLFFGTKDHAWIKKCNLYPYDDHYDKYSAVQDPKLYIAVKAVERYRRELLTDVMYNEHSNEDLQENTRKLWLVNFSNEAIEEVENEKKRQKLKRKKTPGKDSTQSSLSRKKPKMSPSKDVRKEPQRTGKSGTNVRFQVSKKHKTYSFAKYARKESKLSGKHKANKADLKKNSSRENSAQSCKKPEIAVSITNSKRGPKHSKKPEASNKSGVEKCSFKGNLARPRKASAKPKTSASARNLRREPKRTSKPQVIIKKSKIRYMASSGSSFVFPGPSTSARVPEIANGRIVVFIITQSF
ncbi:hypothetical protein AVEN_174212-1 [Araneus ventricosus]|uniref:PWWP domain-containing protein n=1 Tax=Araneus ventricosus TaxID=182803 RepID=A0A4Y2IXB3_ARAVE|nr:hypothetical protein AVEN_174212-1 [Araneus ventricosus]